LVASTQEEADGLGYGEGQEERTSRENERKEKKKIMMARWPLGALGALPARGMLRKTTRGGEG